MKEQRFRDEYFFVSLILYMNCHPGEQNSSKV